MDGKIEYHYYKEGYGVINLNRPKKHNAISQSMMDSLQKSIRQAKIDNVKCLLVTAAGEKMFCSGGDLIELHGDLTNEEAYKRLNKMKEILYELAVFPVPTIALLNGSALGGGCEIATACDFRYAREMTHFGFVQANLGIIPGWGGGALLYEKVQPIFAYQWLMEANKYSVDMLKHKGWIHKIIPNNEWESRMFIPNLVQPYLKRSVDQMKILKRQFLQHIDIDNLYQKMSEEVYQCSTLWDSDEHIEAVNQFLKKPKD